MSELHSSEEAPDQPLDLQRPKFTFITFLRRSLDLVPFLVVESASFAEFSDWHPLLWFPLALVLLATAYAIYKLIWLMVPQSRTRTWILILDLILLLFGSWVAIFMWLRLMRWI